MTLAERFLSNKGYRDLRIFWGNPYTSPPDGADRTLWAVCVPNDEDFREIVETYAPVVIPGCGWAHGVSPHGPEPRRLAPEVKGNIRKKSLKRRLDAKVPLFAEEFYNAEVARRPDYFAGQDPAPSMIGHNGGPRL